MFTRGSEVIATAVYGVAADAVQRVEIETGSGGPHQAELADNAFRYLAAGNRSHPASTVPRRRSGQLSRRKAAASRRSRSKLSALGKERLPLTFRDHPRSSARSARHECRGSSRASRGEPYAWTGDPSLAVTTSRVLQPDPESSFKMAVAYGTSADGYERYCFVWLWPLVKGTGSYGCALAGVT